MRGLLRVGSEVLFAALLYVTGSLFLGVIKPGPSTSKGLVLLVVLHVLAFVAVAVYALGADGSWPSEVGSAVLALMVFQILIPELETALERHTSLGRLPVTVGLAAVAATVAFSVYLLMLPDTSAGRGLPPYPWPAGSPLSYAWRVPALVVLYAGVHVAAMRLGRAIFGQVGRVSFAGEVAGRLLCGAAVVLVLLALAAHLGVRTVHSVVLLAGVTVWVGIMGRLALAYQWSAATIAVRLGLRACADLLVVAGAAWLLLPGEHELMERETLAGPGARPLPPPFDSVS